MRFLVDECLPARLAVDLRRHGYDAVHVVDVGLSGKPDVQVMALGAVEGRVLLSADTDFGELLATSGDVAPSVILLRGLGGNPAGRIDMIVNNLPQLREYLEAGAIAVITDSRIRVRRLPV